MLYGDSSDDGDGGGDGGGAVALVRFSHTHPLDRI